MRKNPRTSPVRPDPIRNQSQGQIFGLYLMAEVRWLWRSPRQALWNTPLRQSRATGALRRHARQSKRSEILQHMAREIRGVAQFRCPQVAQLRCPARPALPTILSSSSSPRLPKGYCPNASTIIMMHLLLEPLPHVADAYRHQIASVRCRWSCQDASLQSKYCTRITSPRRCDFSNRGKSGNCL
jgi:hypothetical protein